MDGVRAHRSLGLALESAVAALGTALDRHSPKLLYVGLRLCAYYAGCTYINISGWAAYRLIREKAFREMKKKM